MINMMIGFHYYYLYIDHPCNIDQRLGISTKVAVLNLPYYITLDFNCVTLKLEATLWNEFSNQANENWPIKDG